MSAITITVERIESVEPHPQADRLELAKVAGTQTLIVKGQFKAGDLCVYFPPDICLPPDLSERLGVQKCLKHALFDGQKIACRVAATRLRGTPSYGFAQPLPACPELPRDVVPGQDVTTEFQATKYEPPVNVYQGGLASEPPNFHHYTDIQHYRKYGHLLEAGMPVRITEKIHGMNSRVGRLKVDDDWQFVAGSHKTTRKQIDPEGRQSVYWEPLQRAGVRQLLTEHTTALGDDVILFGELYDPGVQDLDYGIRAGEIGWRLFDITRAGRYLDWHEIKRFCQLYGIETVPLLYEGPFTPELIAQLTYGPTMVAPSEEIACRFKDREGIVITPLVERHAHIGRLILKNISADYLDRPGAKDAGEL